MAPAAAPGPSTWPGRASWAPGGRGRLRTPAAPRRRSPGLTGLGLAGLGLAGCLAERLAQQRRVVRAHLECEMRQRRAPVRAGGQRVAHQRRGVTGPGPGGLITPGPAVPLAAQPALAVQVLHHRHHGGVSRRPVVMQSVDHLADKHRPAPLPQPVHDHRFQLTETSHSHSRTWLCQTTRPPLPTITHRASPRFRHRLTFLPASRPGAASGPGTHRKRPGLACSTPRRRPGKVPGECPRAEGGCAGTAAATVNATFLLSVLVDMSATTDAPGGELPGDPDAAIRLLYSRHARALHAYVARFGPDRASADDIVQETFIRAWRHLPQLSADNRPIRPC